MTFLNKYLLFFSLFLTSLFVPVFAQAQNLSTLAQYAVVMDGQTGTLLFDKNADEVMYPASMTKMMTAYLVFERLKDGRLSMDDTFYVSERAWRKGGSKMFVEVGKEVSVSDLLRGIIVQSGNDACIVIAEGLSGTEEAFVGEMNAKAVELGMTNTNFRNSTGWPDPDHTTTVKDLAILGYSLIRDFPNYYPIYSERSFTYSDIKQYNRNPLLSRNIGADGIKTGHTEDAGYGLAASAVQDGQRLVMVAAGMPSKKARAGESEKLLRWAFREFNNETLVKAGTPVAQASVWMSKDQTVALAPIEDAIVTVPRRSYRDIKVFVTYDGPVAAPIEKGQKIGTLHVQVPDQQDVLYPLYAAKDVEKLSGFGKIVFLLKRLIWGDNAS